MPVLVTPRRLEMQGELYHQLAALTAAGIGLISALEMVSIPYRPHCARCPVVRSTS